MIGVSKKWKHILRICIKLLRLHVDQQMTIKAIKILITNPPMKHQVKLYRKFEIKKKLKMYEKFL